MPTPAYSVFMEPVVFEMIVVDLHVGLQIPPLAYRHVVESADAYVGTYGSARQRYAGILHVKRKATDAEALTPHHGRVPRR